MSYGGVELLEEDGELSEAPLVLQGPHDPDLGVQGVTVVLGGEGEEIANGQFDMDMFKVGERPAVVGEVG